MTVVARTFASIPTRSASETWGLIVDLLAGRSDGPARLELTSVCGIAASLITDHCMTEPIVVYGVGPRVRIYCVYDDAALEQDGVNEQPLSFDPTDGDWAVSLPCTKDDLDWISDELKKRSARISARDIADGGAVDSEKAQTPEPVGNVNKEAFLRK